MTSLFPNLEAIQRHKEILHINLNSRRHRSLHLLKFPFPGYCPSHNLRHNNKVLSS